jgi:hypothetical protein
MVLVVLKQNCQTLALQAWQTKAPVWVLVRV